MSEKLKEINSTLDVFGPDRKVLQIAYEDLMNYLKFHWTLVGKKTDACELVDKLEKVYNENPCELEECLGIWAGIWFKKWKERVKLLIGSENSKRWNRVTKILNNAEPAWRQLSNRQEMEEMIISTLIKNGEICGTSILAENLLKIELGGKDKEYVNGGEQLLVVVNNALRKARELARSEGPLIYVKIDKGYYNGAYA